MTGKDLALTGGGPVPAITQAGIRKLFVCAPSSSNMNAEDRVLLMRAYADQAAKYPLAVVGKVFDELITNNPRNPYLPTVQDVYLALDRGYRNSLTNEQMVALVEQRVRENQKTKAFGTHDSGP